MMKSTQKIFGLFLGLLLLPSAVYAGAQENPATVSVTAKVTEVDGDGTIFLDLSAKELAEAGIHLHDMVTVTVNGKSFEMPVDDSLDYAMFRQPFCIANEDTQLTLLIGSFVEDLKLGKQVVDGDGYKWEWEEGTSQPETVLIELTEQDAFKPAKTQNVGILSLLNLNEEILVPYVRTQNYASSCLTNAGIASINPGADEYLPGIQISVTSFDSLSQLLLGLTSGRVDYALVSESVADYICRENESVQKQLTYNMEADMGLIDEAMCNILFNDYSIMLSEENAKLRDEIDAALDQMRGDGTLDQLVLDYITNGTDEVPVRVKFDQFDGAESIRFVVTGDLPPMDYMAADETPAGFSTAVLAEIGRRLKKNIKIISAENLSRALELENGHADAAFWTRTKDHFTKWMNEFDTDKLTSETNIEQLRVERLRFMSLMEMIGEDANFLASLNSDVPEGLLTTEAYFSEPVVLIHMAD